MHGIPETPALKRNSTREEIEKRLRNNAKRSAKDTKDIVIALIIMGVVFSSLIIYGLSV